MNFEKQKSIEWWKTAVFYHVYPRSFYDSNNDGIGDIQGIINKLEYLNELGVDAIWLSPIYDSPMKDYGYDVRNYRKIDTSYGDINDFEELLKKAHFLGIKIIMDLILNHTSIEHKWFLESSSSKKNDKRDWYIWRKGIKKSFPNNWKSVFGGSAWQYNEYTSEYYLHTFLKEQADLNWRNSSMRKAFFEEIKFWLDLGVDGFRLDVINMIIKDKKFRNNPSIVNFFNPNRKLFNRNHPKSHKIVKKVRKLVESYGNKVLVGEIFNTPPGNSELPASYLGNNNDGLHLAFDFSLFFKRWNAKTYYNSITKTYDALPSEGWPCFVLSNHDLNRSINRFGKNKEEKAIVAAVLLLTLKGTPFIYYGEELSMSNIKISKNDLADPLGKKYWPFYKGRDRSRSPMQWNSRKNAGFSQSKPWLPVSANYKEINAETLENLPNSILNNYKQLIFIRKKFISLQIGDWVPLINGDDNILAYKRIYKKEVLNILLNFSGHFRTVCMPEGRYRYVYTNHPETVSLMVAKVILLQPFQTIILQSVYD